MDRCDEYTRLEPAGSRSAATTERVDRVRTVVDPLQDGACEAAHPADVEADRQVVDDGQAITGCGAVEATVSHVHVEGENAGDYGW